MKNLFDSDNYPDGVPAQLVPGAQWAWRNSEITAVYPTADYTLKFEFSPLDGSQIGAFTITATKTAASHIVLDSSTNARTPNQYRWRAMVTRDSDSASVQVDDGVVEVEDTDSLEGPYSYRVLIAIRKTIKGTASQEQSRIEIGGRVLENRSIGELLDLEREFSKRWRREQAEIERKAGRAAKSRVLVKMEA